MAPGKKAFVYVVKVSYEVTVYANDTDEAMDAAISTNPEPYQKDTEIISTDTNDPTEPDDTRREAEFDEGIGGPHNHQTPEEK